MKIYICGKVTGDVNYRNKFLKAEDDLYEAGFYPINPAACVPSNTDWNGAMRIALGLMLRCEGVAILGDWRSSKGAKIEVKLARKIGIPVMTLDRWVAKNGLGLLL
jgi:hypothetical protein